MAIAGAVFQEPLGVGMIEVAGIERPLLTFARCAVPLKISQVRGCGISALPAQTDEPRLDDDTPASGA
jgi:hypothetical protein